MMIKYNKNSLKSGLEHASSMEFKIKWLYPFSFLLLFILELVLFL